MGDRYTEIDCFQFIFNKRGIHPLSSIQKMKVFKFGGASVKDAVSVRKIPVILSKYAGESLVLIISAMGKTTNALEALVRSAYDRDGDAEKHIQGIRDYHMRIVRELFPGDAASPDKEIENVFAGMDTWISNLKLPGREHPYDFYYDQVVPAGELLSTIIISQYLNKEGYHNTLLDARDMVVTDSTYRSAAIDWDTTGKHILKSITKAFSEVPLVVTQGFIGSNGEFSTTLGREGSDFSAAIFANVLDAEAVVVWKDVPGYLNADPRYFSDTVKLDKLSYAETIELAFYGAKIIHPKTIRPLKNKNIPLYVRSFLEPDSEGSLIHTDLSSDTLVPSCIIKQDQVLISISSRDFSFIAEEHLHEIFGIFARHRGSINLMQNSAISFSVCVDNTSRLKALIGGLQETFRVKYNDGLQLITIRHYNPEIINLLTSGKEILLEQRSRVTVQMVVK